MYVGDNPQIFINLVCSLDVFDIIFFAMSPGGEWLGEWTDNILYPP